MGVSNENRPDAIGALICAGKHRKALGLLASQHGAEIGRLCMAIVGNQAEAEELTQEVLVAAFRAMPSFAGKSTARTWVYTIARRTCFRARKKGQGRLHLLRTVHHDSAERPPDPMEALTSRQTNQRLQLAMAELTEAQREVLLLRYASDLSWQEVAAICDIREDAARQRAQSGMRRLRKLLTGAPSPTQASYAACQEV